MTGLSMVRAISHGVVRLAARHGSRRLSDRRIVRVIGLEAEYAAMAPQGSRTYTRHSIARSTTEPLP
jgi:hypothetical protein